MSKPCVKTLLSLTIAAVVSVANIAYAQDSIPDDAQNAEGEPDAGGNAGTGGTSGSEAGTRSTGGTSAHAATTAAGGIEQGGGTRVMPSPDMNGCACRIARPGMANSSTAGVLVLAAAVLSAVRKRCR